MLQGVKGSALVPDIMNVLVSSNEIYKYIHFLKFHVTMQSVALQEQHFQTKKSIESCQLKVWSSNKKERTQTARIFHYQRNKLHSDGVVVEIVSCKNVSCCSSVLSAHNNMTDWELSL